MNWISVDERLPDVEPNTDGKACAVIGESGNIYRARWMHDLDDVVDTKYWSEFTIDHRGRENEHYEINEKIVCWIELPEKEEKEEG